MGKAKRILFVCNVDWFFCSHRLNIAVEAKSRGWDVHLLTCVTDKRSLLEDSGIRVYHLPLRRGGIPVANAVLCFFIIVITLVRLRPDIAHLITPKINILGGLACRLCFVPQVYVAISGFGNSLSKGTCIARLLYRAALGGGQVSAITQTKHDRDIVLNLGPIAPERIHIIPGSGVDIATYVPQQSNDAQPVILLACRLLNSKGVGHFIDVANCFAASTDDDVRPKFLLAGKFDFENPDAVDRRTVERAHAAGIICYVGAPQSIANVLQQATIFFYPSTYGEGLPKVLCEAAACGVPVLTTDHPGCRDAIVPGQTGELLPSLDVVTSQKMIRKLLTTEGLLQRYSQAARRLAESRFDESVIVSQHFLAYDCSPRT